MKCELCGKHTDRLYTVLFDEGEPFNICGECMPDEVADDVRDREDNQVMMQNMMAKPYNSHVISR